MQNEMVSAADILARIKSWVDATNDAELASELGVAPSTLSSWRQRDSIPYAFCVRFALERNVGLDWLILGRGDVPVALGDSGEPIDRDALELAIEELSDVGFDLLGAHESATAIADSYEKFTEIISDLETAGLPRDAAVKIIRRVGKSRASALLIDRLSKAFSEDEQDGRDKGSNPQRENGE